MRKSRLLGTCLALPLVAGTCGTASPGAAVESQPAEQSMIPKRAPAETLAPVGLEHQFVLQIDQDFHPNKDYEIALDAWISRTSPDELTEVRMWWLDTSKAGERSSFGRGVKRHITIGYKQETRSAWLVEIRLGSSAYDFRIEVEDGKATAFGDVASQGETFSKCRITQSRLVAKKVLGIPVGFDRIEATCVDGQKTREGQLVARRV